MNDVRTVDADAFRQWMAPTGEVMCACAAAVEAIAARHPAATSQAMRELAAEKNYQESGWHNPITDTHTFGAMTLRAAADYARTFAEAFDARRPPLYGHLVVARAALEASVVSAWLNEPDIPCVDRIKRGMCERLYSANEVNRLKVVPNAAQTLTECEADAASFGWAASFARGKPVVDGTARPSVGDGITELLVDDSEAKLGRLMWSRLSAVTHVTWWGLGWALDLPSLESDGSGFMRVPMATDSSQVAIQALCVLKALRVAATKRFTLTGWSDDPQWQAAFSETDEHERVL